MRITLIELTQDQAGVRLHLREGQSYSETLLTHATLDLAQDESNSFALNLRFGDDITFQSIICLPPAVAAQITDWIETVTDIRNDQADALD